MEAWWLVRFWCTASLIMEITWQRHCQHGIFWIFIPHLDLHRQWTGGTWLSGLHSPPYFQRLSILSVFESPPGPPLGRRLGKRTLWMDSRQWKFEAPVLEILNSIMWLRLWSALLGLVSCLRNLRKRNVISVFFRPLIDLGKSGDPPQTCHLWSFPAGCCTPSDLNQELSTQN